eukprot:scaffold282804_cov28-Tisochrysis_lutea.AAC.1
MARSASEDKVQQARKRSGHRHMSSTAACAGHAEVRALALLTQHHSVAHLPVVSVWHILPVMIGERDDGGGRERDTLVGRSENHVVLQTGLHDGGGIVLAEL